jgi:hypothetical protein
VRAAVDGGTVAPFRVALMHRLVAESRAVRDRSR